jgi:hypothetical protein
MITTHSVLSLMMNYDQQHAYSKYAGAGHRVAQHSTSINAVIHAVHVVHEIIAVHVVVLGSLTKPCWKGQTTEKIAAHSPTQQIVMVAKTSTCSE